MLERAAASYPPRAGPRRNKEAERQRNRRSVSRDCPWRQILEHLSYFLVCFVILVDLLDPRRLEPNPGFTQVGDPEAAQAAKEREDRCSRKQAGQDQEEAVVICFVGGGGFSGTWP